MSSSDDSDLKKKMNDSDEEEEYSDNDKYKKEASNKNAEKFQEKEEDAKEEPKQIKPAIKEKNESEEDSDSSEKKKNQIQEKDNKKDNIKDDTKEKKPNNKKSNDDSDSSESSNSSKEKKIEKQKKIQELKAKREKENAEKLRKAIAEKEKKEKEIEEKNEKIAEEKKFEEDKKEEQTKIIPKLINNKNDNPPWRRNDNNFQRNNNNNNNNINNNPYQNQQNSYVKKKGKKYDLNEEKILNNIISENNEIIEEMKNAYPGITKLDCAYILKKLKVNTSSQTLFEIMNRVHRDISTEITLNRENDTDKKILPQIDPYEIIDTFYSNPDHVNMMKFFKIYCYEDKEKLPPYLQESLPSFFYYNKNKERIERRRKLVKYIDGSFNYIPRTCPSKNCEDNNCPYSHNDNENNFHPLYYKTIYMTNLRYNNDSKLIKDAANLFEDFRIIYNYKDENIIKLMKLLDEKKFSKFSYKEYMKNIIGNFSLNTFKTLECPSIKSGIKCPKSDPHLCYYYHDISEKRRPPILYRYINEMCPDQVIRKGKVKEKCRYGDFCNKCHSRYEYYYHSLFYGKAITCKRPKKLGKCIFEETCYAYHPYKEPGYKRTKEEIIREKKDELLQKSVEEENILNKLIEKFRCPKCRKFKKTNKYYLLLNCEHVICAKCFKEEKRCPKCKEKIKKEKEGEDFILIDITSSSKDIDKLMKENYKKKKENEKINENKEDEKIKKEEIKEDLKVEKEEKKNNEDEENKDDNDNDNQMNSSM